MKITLLCVGKTKSSEIESLIQTNKKRIHLYQTEIRVIKSHGDNVEREQEEIQKELKKSHSSDELFLMTEHGKLYDSNQFSQRLKSHYESSRDICIIRGGASGFTKEFRLSFKNQISLSPMTFPHEFSQLLMIEQIYRAQCILENHPYHK